MKAQAALIVALIIGYAGTPAVAQTIETHSFPGLNLAVPDGSSSGLSDRRTINSGLAGLASLKVRLQVTGEYNGDLYAYLRHVQGTTTNFCVLINRPGRTAADTWGYDDSGLNITFDDAAANGDLHVYRNVVTPTPGTALTGSWRPDGRAVDPDLVTDASPRTTSLTSFTGVNPDGEWTLFVADLDSGATNLLAGWELEFSGGMIPAVSWSAPADIVYGTALSSTQLNATSPVAGSFAYSPASGTVLHAGNSQTLSVTFTPTDTAAYVPVTTTVPLNVLKKQLTITANNASKVFGAPLPAFSVTYAGFITGESSANLDTGVSIGTTGTPSSPAGPYPITPSGAADADYSMVYVNGTLTISAANTTSQLATSANPAAPGQVVTFTLQVTPVPPGAGSPSGTAQFYIDGSPSGAPSTVAAGIATLSLSTLPAGSHSVSVNYLGDGNFTASSAALAQAQLINSAPVANGDSIDRDPSANVKVLITTLLSNDTDPDGDTFQLLSVSPTTPNGGSVVVEGDWIHYTPAAGFTNDDSFTYTIADTYAAQGTGTVQVRAVTANVPSPNLTMTDMGNGSFDLQFDGVPGIVYRIECKEALSDPAWVELGSETADPSGAFRYVDTPPPGVTQRVYRSVYP